MKNFWQKYLEWQKKRKQNFPKLWEKKREKGWVRFVLSISFIWCAWMVGWTSLTDYYFDGYFDWGNIPFKIIMQFISGLIIGSVIWWQIERTYQKAIKAKNVS